MDEATCLRRWRRRRRTAGKAADVDASIGSPVPPPPEVLAAFGLEGPMLPLAGGRGRSWRVGEAVVKPVNLPPSALAWRASLLARLDGRDDFRVSVPLRTDSGALSRSGWTASRYEEGRHEARRWLDIIDVGRRLHAAVQAEPEPAFLHDRRDPWSQGDRVAWGDEPMEPYAGADTIRPLAAALRPVTGRPQLIHGDLTGNVLFAEDLPRSSSTCPRTGGRRHSPRRSWSPTRWPSRVPALSSSSRFSVSRTSPSTCCEP
jgi:hypothetical protein